MEVEGIRQKGRPKTWWDCVKNDMESLGLSQKIAQSRHKWRRRIKGQPANPGSSGKMAVKRSVCVWLCVLDLGPMYGTDRQSSDRQTSDMHQHLMPIPRGEGIINSRGLLVA